MSWAIYILSSLLLRYSPFATHGTLNVALLARPTQVCAGGCDKTIATREIAG